MKIAHRTKTIEPEITDDSIFLFKVRLSLEKAITDICERTDYNGPNNLYNKIRHLLILEVLNGVTVETINEIVKIGNRGVHGEIISKEYKDFVRQVFPDIQDQLKNVIRQLRIFCCPRCNYTGYSRYENVCPKCGRITDN